MNRLLTVLCISLLSAIPSLADTTVMQGFMSEIKGFPPQPFSDIKYLNIPDDFDEPYRFDDQKWEYEGEVSNDVDLFESTSSNDKMLIDCRGQYGPDVMVLVLIKGSISYYYTDDLQAVKSSLQGNGGSYDSDSDSSNYGGGSNYESLYKKWERQAEHAYDSLTHASVSSSTYVRNKQLLRDAQNEMRKCRRKAASAGITINKSEWEDAQVKLR